MNYRSFPSRFMPETPSFKTSVRARILIIDDEESIRESLEALLTLERFDVETAPDATSGLFILILTRLYTQLGFNQ